MGKRLTAELLGTFWLVFGGCGSAILAAKFLDAQNLNVNYGIGLVGVAFAFGLTVLTMAYAIGHISGCHLNPAVSVGLCVGGRFPSKEVLPYIAAQIVGHGHQPNGLQHYSLLWFSISRHQYASPSFR